MGKARICFEYRNRTTRDDCIQVERTNTEGIDAKRLLKEVRKLYKRADLRYDWEKIPGYPNQRIYHIVT